VKDTTVVRKLSADLFGPTRRHVSEDRSLAVGIDEVRPTTHARDMLVALKKGDLLGDPFWVTDIVRVHSPNEVVSKRLYLCKTVIEGSSKAYVFLQTQHSNIRITELDRLFAAVVDNVHVNGIGTTTDALHSLL